MTSVRLLAFSLLSASTFLACSTSSGRTATGTSSAGGSSAGPGGSSATSSGTAGGGHGGSGAGGGDGGLILDVDGGDAGDASACSHLNIGILGKPGANASSNFQQWLTMSGTSVQRFQTTTTVPLTAADLQPFDVIILDWLTRDYTASEAAIVAAFVTAGGGLASMSGYSSSSTNDWHANSLLAPLEVTYSGNPIDGPVTMFAAHPITVGLTSVTFAGGFAITDLGGTASTRTPIAFLPQGTGNVAVGYAIQMGAGHAFVWGDEWIEFDSQWSTLPQIKQLWVQVFAWVSPTNKCALMPPT